MQRVEDLAGEHVAAFNGAVASGDFAAFLDRFAGDAVMRFENVPGAGVLEFVGRAACAAAYAEGPPDDQISIAGPVHDDAGTIAIPFVWQREGGSGTMRLTLRDGRISRLVVAFA